MAYRRRSVLCDVGQLPGSTAQTRKPRSDDSLDKKSAQAVKLLNAFPKVESEDTQQTVCVQDGVGVTLVRHEDYHPLRLVIGTGTPFYLVHHFDAGESEETSDDDLSTSVTQQELEELQEDVAIIPVGKSHDHKLPQLIESWQAASNVAVSRCERKTHLPLSLPEARKFISQCSLGLRLFDTKLPPIFAMSSSPKHAYVGVEYAATQGNLHYLSIDKELNPVTSKQLPKIKPLVDQYKFRANLGDRTTGFGQVAVHTEARYQILGSSMHSTETSSICLKFDWEGATELNTEPPHAATSTAFVHAIPQWKQGPCAAIRRELERLRFFATVQHFLSQEHSIDEAWDLATQELQFVQAQTEGLIENVDSLIESTTIMDGEAFSVNNQHTAAAPGMDSDFFSPRTSLDMTERVWYFVKDASTYNELKTALGIIFNAMRTGELQPLIHRGNTCQMAQLAVECVRAHRNAGKAAGPNFGPVLELMKSLASSPSALLACVFEAGVNKMHHDFVKYVVGRELATGAQLTHFFETAGATDVTTKVCGSCVRACGCVCVHEHFTTNVSVEYSCPNCAGCHEVMAPNMQSQQHRETSEEWGDSSCVVIYPKQPYQSAILVACFIFVWI
eukprot:m.131502 g.131502  ORF g.131502 m.131502 type:complete len:617 (+) comp13916_c0_seq6:38-1888(+)